MTTEDYCSYELSQLLKEKGFEGVCEYAYSNKGNYFEKNTMLEFGEVYCLRPTHQMAMKWLREVHNIFIQIKRDNQYYEGIPVTPMTEHDKNVVIVQSIMQ